MRERQDMDPITLQAWMDDELSEGERRRVEEWLASRPEVRERLERQRALDDELRRRFAPVLEEPLPDELLGAAGAGGWGRKWRGSGAGVPARAALLFVGVAIGWILHGWGDPGGSPLEANLLTPAAFAHGVYATDSRHPVELPASAHRQLAAWISERMYADISPPDLTGVGLVLLGGRLLPSTNRMAAQFLYEDSRGRRYTLYMRRWDREWHGLSERPHRRRTGGVEVWYWRAGAFAHALVGSAGEETMRRIAAAVAGTGGFRGA